MEDLIDTFNKGLNAFVYPQLDTKTNNLSGLGLLWEYCYEIYKKNECMNPKRALYQESVIIFIH